MMTTKYKVPNDLTNFQIFFATVLRLIVSMAVNHYHHNHGKLMLQFAVSTFADNN